MGIPGDRRRGRPNKRWMDNIKEDMRNVGLVEEDTRDEADGNGDKQYAMATLLEVEATEKRKKVKQQCGSITRSHGIR